MYYNKERSKFVQPGSPVVIQTVEEKKNKSKLLFSFILVTDYCDNCYGNSNSR